MTHLPSGHLLLLRPDLLLPAQCSVLSAAQQFPHIISEMDMGSKLLSEVKTWALELWQSFNHGELFMPAVGGPEGDPVYDTAAIENEVSNVRASMSIRVFQKNTFFQKK